MKETPKVESIVEPEKPRKEKKEDTKVIKEGQKKLQRANMETEENLARESKKSEKEKKNTEEAPTSAARPTTTEDAPTLPSKENLSRPHVVPPTYQGSQKRFYLRNIKSVKTDSLDNTIKEEKAIMIKDPSASCDDQILKRF